MTTRTERLEAALRNMLSVIDSRSAPARVRAKVEARAALADTAPSCCEEVRRAALDAAAKAVESHITPPHQGGGTAIEARNDALTGAASRIRALSNQAPPKSEHCGALSKNARGVRDGVACELPKGHGFIHQGARGAMWNGVELCHHDTLRSDCPKCAPPVCPTCGGSGYVLTKGSTWRTGSGEEAGTFGGKASCPDCAGGGK